jgi:hypothetical protein
MRNSLCGAGCARLRVSSRLKVQALIPMLVALIGLLVWPSTSRAESTTIVDLSDGFPSEDLPLGEPFVLEKKVGPDVKDAFGVFFEYAYGAFGSKAP